MSKQRQPTPPEDEDKVTVYVRGAGVAYVDPEELLRSKKVQALFAKCGEVVREERRKLAAERQGG